MSERPPLATRTLRHIGEEAQEAWRQGATEIRVVFTPAGRATVLRCFQSASIAIETEDEGEPLPRGKLASAS